MDFIIFFSIVITVFSAVNYYIFIRGWQAFPEGSTLRKIYWASFVILSFSYLLGRLSERFIPVWAGSGLIWIGSYWLAAMAYFLMIVALLDLVRLVNHFLPFYPAIVTADYAAAKQWIAGMVIAAVAIVVALGSVNAFTPRIRTLDLTIPKKNSKLSSLNIVMASDIHLGTMVCQDRLARIVDTINELQPDLILLPGDVIDEDLAPVIRQNLGETLKRLSAKYGIYAVTGNHEYIGGVEPAVRYLEAHNVKLLRDTAVTIDGSLCVVGREDISGNRMRGKKRKTLAEILVTAEKSLPVIVMDHQPFHLEESAQAGVDLQLSGHTHYGQMWPFNYITHKVYELDWGYLKKENTNYYVSCGVGTWGPPVRIGNTPEIVQIRLRFE
ncbi:MAG: metallophosphoesterase [Ignavibacteriales bacterium]|nr:metallophosphoesterase [Ignavibacteriales bacterium]